MRCACRSFSIVASSPVNGTGDPGGGHASRLCSSGCPCGLLYELWATPLPPGPAADEPADGDGVVGGRATRGAGAGSGLSVGGGAGGGGGGSAIGIAPSRITRCPSARSVRLL